MWIPDVGSFAEAAALDGEQLQRVLESGAPEQRLWAIWAIALRSGGRVGPLGNRPPDAGARRTLAVVLAGHGQVVPLIELATRDPDLHVRETAIQLVTRLAAGGAIAREVVEQALERDPGIRVAALGAVGRGAPPWLVAIARGLLLDRDPEIAGEAFEALLRLDTTDGREAARAWLLARPDPWSFVARWLRGGDAIGLADALRDTPMAVRGRVLERLRAPPWQAVELLVGGDLELLRGLLGRLDVAIPSTILAHAILRGAHAGFARKLVEQLATASDGRALLAELRVATSGELDGHQLRRLWERARRYADAIELPDRDALLADLLDTHPVELLFGLENAVSRWVDTYEAPLELLAMLDELQPYCADLRERLQLAGADRPRAPQLGGGHAARDDHSTYLDIVALVRALDRLALARR